ncbi:uncharacterized protein F5891DRAFT_1277777 [Suillus fuscotomentosus]|uniref:Uncharacterized protein n=1 Tax=Suillus fuscotomentosus TaxID=1912939 RepID=A0AAD4E8U8_9AGAM|nr:uncharacterized protein F5891DRAFT_1277777 [Suillus fuscotomentosus]KAG1901456.1 hypothetical protein F5891DRAFT_1277777 [Suillus fuscotomentosus]
MTVQTTNPQEQQESHNKEENDSTLHTLFSDNSDATSLESADELSEAVVPSLLAEECPPVKR